MVIKKKRNFQGPCNLKFQNQGTGNVLYNHKSYDKFIITSIMHDITIMVKDNNHLYIY
jgi:calcineurin-like phosphoesterase